MIRLAAGLELLAVAEWVETEGRLEFFKLKCCDLVQGYLAGRLMDVATFREKFIL